MSKYTESSQNITKSSSVQLPETSFSASTKNIAQKSPISRSSLAHNIKAWNGRQRVHSRDVASGHDELDSSVSDSSFFGETTKVSNSRSTKKQADGIVRSKNLSMFSIFDCCCQKLSQSDTSDSNEVILQKDQQPKIVVVASKIEKDPFDGFKCNLRKESPLADSIEESLDKIQYKILRDIQPNTKTNYKKSFLKGRTTKINHRYSKCAQKARVSMIDPKFQSLNKMSRNLESIDDLTNITFRKSLAFWEDANTLNRLSKGKFSTADHLDKEDLVDQLRKILKKLEGSEEKSSVVRTKLAKNTACVPVKSYRIIYPEPGKPGERQTLPKSYVDNQEDQSSQIDNESTANQNSTQELIPEKEDRESDAESTNSFILNRETLELDTLSLKDWLAKVTKIDEKCFLGKIFSETKNLEDDKEKKKVENEHDHVPIKKLVATKPKTNKNVETQTISVNEKTAYKNQESMKLKKTQNESLMISEKLELNRQINRPNNLVGYQSILLSYRQYTSTKSTESESSKSLKSSNKRPQKLPEKRFSTNYFEICCSPTPTESTFLSEQHPKNMSKILDQYQNDLMEIRSALKLDNRISSNPSADQYDFSPLDQKLNILESNLFFSNIFNFGSYHPDESVEQFQLSPSPKYFDLQSVPNCAIDLQPDDGIVTVIKKQPLKENFINNNYQVSKIHKETIVDYPKELSESSTSSKEESICFSSVPQTQTPIHADKPSKPHQNISSHQAQSTELPSVTGINSTDTGTGILSFSEIVREVKEKDVSTSSNSAAFEVRKPRISRSLSGNLAARKVGSKKERSVENSKTIKLKDSVSDYTSSFIQTSNEIADV